MITILGISIIRGCYQQDSEVYIILLYIKTIIGGIDHDQVH